MKENLGVEDHHLVPEANFENDIGADSIDMLSIQNGIERKYNVNIPTTKMDEIKTVGELIAYVEDLVGV